MFLILIFNLVQLYSYKSRFSDAVLLLLFNRFALQSVHVISCAILPLYRRLLLALVLGAVCKSATTRCALSRQTLFFTDCLLGRRCSGVCSFGSVYCNVCLFLFFLFFFQFIRVAPNEQCWAPQVFFKSAVC